MNVPEGFDPALLERFPTDAPRPDGELQELERIWQAPKGRAVVTAVNNNYVGVWYVGAAFLFFVLAGVLALLMRVQLAVPMSGVLPQEVYNQIFTMHGTVMMFLFAVPAVEALGVLLLPQMLSARDLPFPRLSAYAFWAYLVGGLCFFASIFFGLAPSGGWFMYPPLTSKAFSPGINADFWLLGIGFIEISAIAGAVEIVVGVLRTRAPGMSLDKVPIFAWAMLVFAAMIIIGFPAVILGTLLLELERALNWPFFDPTRGGDPILWQHLFWFFGHPEVYIIFLPAAGLMSMMIPAVVGAPLVGHRLIVLALVATGFISFGVWAHHMFATGLPTISLSFFSAASMAVSVPAGIQVFAWIATIAVGKIRYNAPGLFVLGALIVFVMGGLTGVMVAIVPFDWQVHDTYFVVAHLHYVLIGGMVLPLFAAFYYWAPMVSSRALSDRMGKVVFALVFLGVNVTFLPMHLTGLMGMPRRVYTYQAGLGWEGLNLTSTVGAFMIAAGVSLFVLDLFRNFRFSAGAGAGNPYGGGTLEWLPADVYSTRSIPVVRSRYPLWDDPRLPDDVERGRYLLPGSATGFRETIITSPIRAEPQYLQKMPGPSVWHVAAAIFTAGFFLLLTVQAYWLGVASGIVAVGFVLRWLWDIDWRLPVPEVDVGAGVRIPTYVTGPASHGYWAMGVLLTVLGMISAMLVFSYVFLWSRRPELWSLAPDLSWAAPVALLYLSAPAALALGRARLKAARPRGGLSLVLLAAAAAAALTGGFGLDLATWAATGLDPAASSYGAVVYAFLALQGLLSAVALLMMAFLMARAVRGHVDPERTATADCVFLFTAYTAAHGAAAALWIRLFPLGL